MVYRRRIFLAVAVDKKTSATVAVAKIFSLHAQKQGYTEAQKTQKGWIILYKKWPSEMYLFFQKEFANLSKLRPLAI